jgi:O-antigen/teichoic acid export membrane protein
MSKSLGLAKVSAKGGFNLFWGMAISTIISSLGIIIIARLLSPSDYGLYSKVLIAPNIIKIFRDLGIDQSTIRYTAKYNQEKHQNKLKTVLAAATTFEIIIGTTLSLITYLLSDLIGNTILNRPEIVPLIQIVSIIILADALFKTAQSAFTGYEKMKYNSLTLIIQAIFKTGLMALFVIRGLGVYGAIIGFTTAYILTGITAILLFYTKIFKQLKNQKTTKKETVTQLKTMLRYGLPLSVATILLGLLAQFFLFLIAIYTSDLLFGNFQVATNFAVLITFLVTPVTTILFPAFSKIDAQKEPETTKTVFQSSIKYASLLIVPATFAVMALSQPGVSTIFGEDYQYTPLYLTLYAILYLYTAFGYLSAENLIKSQGKTNVNLKLSTITFTIGLTLSLALIPTYGILGLIAAHLVAGIPSLAISLWWIKKHYKATINWKSSTKILAASAIAALPTYLISTQQILPNWLTLIIGATIYLSTYIIAASLIGAINKTDTQNLKEILKTLGPLTPIINIPLNLIEYLNNKFQTN